jgi:hypothetical protein
MWRFCMQIQPLLRLRHLPVCSNCLATEPLVRRHREMLMQRHQKDLSSRINSRIGKRTGAQSLSGWYIDGRFSDMPVQMNVNYRPQHTDDKKIIQGHQVDFANQFTIIVIVVLIANL